MGWRDEVLDFWFRELTPEDWYSSKEEVDEKIRTRFGVLLPKLAADVPAEVETDPKTALAAIIVFDQFPRNIYRRQPEAFATDNIAVGITRSAIDKEFDAEMTPQERQFLYMPLMHSEVMADQERCVDLFRALGSEEGIKYAVEHRDIVARFGRFPHRNRALGRETTEDEALFLKEHAGYGQ